MASLAPSPRDFTRRRGGAEGKNQSPRNSCSAFPATPREIRLSSKESFHA
jgi:hypothetical protein